MSRSGYSDDCENLGLWRQAVQRSISGKRGQAFLKELLAALEAMPTKRLISGELQDKHGEVCAIGSVGAMRGVDMGALDIDNPAQIAKAFGIAPALVQEIEFINDDDFAYWNRTEPEKRWELMHAWVKKQIHAQSEGEQP